MTKPTITQADLPDVLTEFADQIAYHDSATTPEGVERRLAEIFEQTDKKVDPRQLKERLYKNLLRLEAANEVRHGRRPIIHLLIARDMTGVAA